MAAPVRYRSLLPGLVLLAAAAALGALLGSLLGPKAWTFFLGATLGAAVVVAVLRLRSRRPTGTGRPRAPRSPKGYDLRRDRSTDSQRWPM
jgi:uncharacterized membrane protein YfcA